MLSLPFAITHPAVVTILWDQVNLNGIEAYNYVTRIGYRASMKGSEDLRQR